MATGWLMKGAQPDAFFAEEASADLRLVPGSFIQRSRKARQRRSSETSSPMRSLGLLWRSGSIVGGSTRATGWPQGTTTTAAEFAVLSRNSISAKRVVGFTGILLQELASDLMAQRLSTPQRGIHALVIFYAVCGCITRLAVSQL